MSLKRQSKMTLKSSQIKIQKFNFMGFDKFNNFFIFEERKESKTNPLKIIPKKVRK